VGILSGLAGCGIAFLLLMLGSADGGETITGVSYFISGVIGGICSLACIALSIAVLSTGGRLPGALMILPAMIGSPFTYGFLSFAFFAGIVAAFFGETKAPEESYDTRQSRLQKEVQQRYGARS
jgi:hypothetical protein